MPNILVATLGQSWQVVPELVGFTNPDQVRLYANLPQNEVMRDVQRIGEIDEIWTVTTSNSKALEGLKHLRQWADESERFKLLAWCPAGIDDITTDAQNRQVADLIYRIVLHARVAANGGKVVLSLAGGRKTMSAELQQAGRVFGCDAMLHIVDSLPPQRDAIERTQLAQLTPKDWLQPLPEALAKCFTPIIISRELPRLDSIGELQRLARRFRLPNASTEPPCRVSRETELYKHVHQQLQEASQLYENYRKHLEEQDRYRGGFRALYLLPSSLVNNLLKDKVGCATDQRKDQVAWLRKLPKAELHCHLGGILSPDGMIEVARTIADRVLALRRSQRQLDAEISQIERAVANNHVAETLKQLNIIPTELKQLRSRWACEQPFGVAAFLLAFQHDPSQLDRFLYGSYQDPDSFRGIQFSRYEQLGDLQGSGLLQCRETIAAAIEQLGKLCRQDNIRYLELRCSPQNYTRGGLKIDEVVGEILNGIERIEHCDIRLIFIASRHRDLEQVKELVDLAVERLDEDDRFRQRFVGFDLAGNEQEEASQGDDSSFLSRIRELFSPLREHVIRLTIHAGEGTNVEKIWQAVYELSADRIGHGLTLVKNDRLLERFRDRSIAVELCPSANDQIIGYRNYLRENDRYTRAYPLGRYLRARLRVTINTDNPGISRTNLSEEYWKAAAMTEGGLSKWEILQIVRNGFRSAFCDFETRCRLLREAEREIMDLLT